MARATARATRTPGTASGRSTGMRSPASPPPCGCAATPAAPAASSPCTSSGAISTIPTRPMKSRRVLILVENLPSPFDRRVWQEAGALRDAGYTVSIICPTGRGCEEKFAAIDGIHIWRYDLPTEAEGALGYAVEYSAALFWTFVLSLKVLWTRGFDIVHACNPPDLFFLIGGFYKLFGKKFLFDHHDANPELYVAKFGRKGFFYRLMLLVERLTFRTADVSIATNH